MIYLKRKKRHLHTRLTTDPSNKLESVPAAQTGLYYELDTYQGVGADQGGYYEIIDASNSFTLLKSEIESLTADKDLKLKREFESIPHTSTHSVDTARLPRNAAKNRYQDILPYDHTRVALSGACEYINASFVPIRQEPNVFIATQGPLADTVADMWHMLLQYNVSCVVQLADPVENGRRRCELYWPERQDRSMEVSGVEIQLGEEVCEGEWFRREFVVTQSGNTSTITQFHYTGWRDGTVPEDTSGMVEMLRGVKERHNTNTPICVVCTSGVGRTGVFVLLYTAMKLLESGVHVYLSEIVRTMREHRAYMVQTVEQYRFAYLCLLEMCLGDRGVKMSHSYPDSEATVARIEEEFSYLEFLDSLGSLALVSDAIRPENQSKNTHSASLPYDRNRVVLEADSWHKGDYVNASYVSIRGVKTQFIATLNPHSHTSAAFLQTLWQSGATTVVALETARGWEDMVSGASSSSCYWPEQGLRTEIDRFSVETVSSERIGNLIKQTLTLSDSSVSQSRPLTHYLLMEWEDTGTPSHLLPVVKLAEQVTNQNTGPVVVHCSDAVGKTGVFIVLCCAVSMMRRGGGVNLVQLVKSARTQRRRMVCSKVRIPLCNYSIV